MSARHSTVWTSARHPVNPTCALSLESATCRSNSERSGPSPTINSFRSCLGRHRMPKRVDQNPMALVFDQGADRNGQ